MQRIKDGYKGIYCIGDFTYLGEVNGGHEIGFLKGKPGNNIPSGFAFIVPEITTWQQLEDFFLLPEMEAFWMERNGFALEKYFCKIAKFWDWLEGAPQIEIWNLGGKVSLPTFEQKICDTFKGVNPDAYQNY